MEKAILNFLSMEGMIVSDDIWKTDYNSNVYKMKRPLCKMLKERKVSDATRQM